MNNKEIGRVITPIGIVKEMINMVDLIPSFVVDAGTGDGRFIKELYQYYPNAKYIGIDIDSSLFPNNPPQNVKYIKEDFLLWNWDTNPNLVIGNPPYGIIGQTINHGRKKIKIYKSILSTWQGKYNYYAAFIEKGIRILKDKGQLLFIVPGTFMFLDSFAKLRAFISKNGYLQIYYKGKVFKNANVSSVIISFYKGIDMGCVKIDDDLQRWNGNPISFSSQFTKYLENESKIKIKDLFDVIIAPRTTEIKKYISDNGKIPVLTSKNIKKGNIVFDGIKYYIDENTLSQVRKGLNNPPYIAVTMGFFEKKTLNASVITHKVGWYGDVYLLIPKSTINIDTLKNISEYLSSKMVSRYLQDKYRDLIYHISKSILEDIPLPKEVEK